MQRTQLYYVNVSARFGCWESTFVSSRPPNVGILREAIQLDLDRLEKAIADEEAEATDGDELESKEWIEQEGQKFHEWEACRSVIDSYRSNIETGRKNVDVAGTTVGSIEVTIGEAFVDGR